MKIRHSIAIALTLAWVPFAAQPQAYSSLIDDSFLRETFLFSEADTLKYAGCEAKTFETCTYIWGPPSSKDAKRAALGFLPEGRKILAIYAQSSGPSDWYYVERSYLEPDTIADIGQAALWSETRKQLSVILENGLIIHVNVLDADAGKEDAIAVISHILEGL